MIQCKICKQTFKKQITNSHLKTHNISTVQYKEKYGTLVSDEYKKERSANNKGENNPNFGNKWSTEQKKDLSNKLKGRITHNKGVAMTEEQKEVLSKKAIERYKNGFKNHNFGKTLAEDTKTKISTTLKNNPINIKRRLATKFMKLSNRLDSCLKNIERIQYYNKICESIDIKIIGNINHDHYIEMKCLKCNGHMFRTLQVLHDSKVRKDLCNTCRKSVAHSKDEFELLGFCREYFESASTSRKHIYPYEIDIFIPELNLGIEYCGLYWHSELAGKDRKYHLTKLEECNSKSIQLITIFEDEWKYKRDIVLSRIKNILGKIDNKIYARKCTLEEISSKEANKFLNQNHLQGAGRSNKRYGLYYNNELVSVMTFSNSNISRKLKGWELDRFASKIDISVIGGASKLFKHFVKYENPKTVISYSDRRWSNGNLYKQLGFGLSHNSSPNYWYINNDKRKHRFSLRKNSNDNQALSEWENRKLQGWNRIWDCGHQKWVWRI